MGSTQTSELEILLEQFVDSQPQIVKSNVVLLQLARFFGNVVTNSHGDGKPQSNLVISHQENKARDTYWQTSRKWNGVVVCDDLGLIGWLPLETVFEAVATRRNWKRIKTSTLALQSICVLSKEQLADFESTRTYLQENPVGDWLLYDDGKHTWGPVLRHELVYSLDKEVGSVSSHNRRIQTSLEQDQSTLDTNEISQTIASDILAKTGDLALGSQSTYHNESVSEKISHKVSSCSTLKESNRQPNKIPKGISIPDREQQLYLEHQRAKLLAEVALKIRKSLNLHEILSTSVQEVQNILEVDRVLIYKVNADGTGQTISEAVIEKFPRILGVDFPEEVFPLEYQDKYAGGRVQAISDIHDSNRVMTECLIEFLDAWQVKAKLVVPIVQDINSKDKCQDSNGSGTSKLWGLLIAHHCQSPRQWTGFELELLQQLANQIGIAISQAQLLENLEDLVAERTSELTFTNTKLQQQIKIRLSIEDALRRSEEQLRLITDALPALIAYVDSHKRYQFNNKTYESWLGFSTSTLRNQHIRNVLGENFYRENSQHIDAVLSGRTVSYECDIATQDGRLLSVNVMYVPHIDEVGDVKGFFSLISDITERKAVEQMKDEFITIVSHELRTPLTSIHGSLTLLASKRLGTLTPKGQRMLEIADESTERLVRLVNNILDLQRMESGKVQMDIRPCQVANLLAQSLASMQVMAQQRQVKLKTQSVAAFVHADQDLLVQALTNLLSNAIKFSSPGSSVMANASFTSAAELRVLTQSTSQDDLYIQFEVRDEGQGIPSDRLEHIFERFQQVDASDSRKKGGTGLGLAICRKIVQQHNGRIWAESHLGKGSSFYFVLPALSKK